MRLSYEKEQEAQLSTVLTAYIQRLAFDFRSRKDSDFPERLQFHTHYGDAAISNATINARIRYGNCGQTAADRGIVTTDNL